MNLVHVSLTIYTTSPKQNLWEPLVLGSKTNCKALQSTERACPLEMMPRIPVLWRLAEDAHIFETSLYYIARHSLKKKKERKLDYYTQNCLKLVEKQSFLLFLLSPMPS